MKNWFFILLLFLPFSCQKKVAVEESDVYKIRELGELATSEYTMSKVLQLDDEGKWYIIGERKILISCQAKAKAGIDLMLLEISDVDLTKGEIKIGIPKIQLQSFEMLPESVETELTEVSGFRDAFSQEEKNEILRQGEKNIRANLNKTGIYKDAYENAVVFIESFYRDLGFEKITIYATQGKI